MKLPRLTVDQQYHEQKSSFLPEKVHIRQVVRDDLPDLEWDGEYTHFRRMFLDTYQQAELGEALLWVAELEGVGLIGQLFVQLDSHRNELADGHSRAYIHAFRVRSAYRGQGLGTRLLEFAESDLVQRGYQKACLNVGRDNTEAFRLYRRLGYRVVAAEPGRWSYIDHLGVRRDVNEPAWRMEKDLR
jgi:ribosomal protein S18 acetylase RimI-like enzyme